MGIQVAVLGAGPGGYVAAVRAAQLGADVTLIEEEHVGGTCLNWGCIPSKVMIAAARLFEKMKHAQTFGIDVEGTFRVNVPALMERKDRVVQTQRKGILDLLRHHRVDYLNGTGFFKERQSITVRLPDGKEQDVPWDRLILAAGTRPFELPNLPFDGTRILSSNHALGLQEVPESLLIVGGGVIGCEFAFLFSSLGSSVTVVEALTRMLPLPSVDEDCSKVLEREMKKRKIRFLVNRAVESVDEVDGRLRVTIGPSPFLESPGEKEKTPLVETADKVLVCVGRAPNTVQIKGFETLGVTLDGKGWIHTDSRMATNVPGIYAVGDVLGPSKIMLAHVASAEGLTAAENALGGRRRMDYGAVPGAIFTSPEVADVGLTETQAREQGIPAQADTVLFRALGKAHVIGEIAGQAKIVSEKDTGKVLGVHIIGPHATDLIAEATLAVKSGATVEDLSHTIHAHPTLPEIVQETALKATGRALHG